MRLARSGAPMSNLIRVTSKGTPQPAAIERTVLFELSSQLPDRAGDVVHQDGWDLANYSENPVILWGHDHRIPAIGRMSRIGVENGSLVGAVTFASADQHPFADTVFKLVSGGFINAGSVGFIPKRWQHRDDGGIDFLEQELLEYSICNVPMNPSCLARAVAGGIDIAPLAKAADAENAASYEELRNKLLASNTAPRLNPSPAMLQLHVRAKEARLRLTS